MMLTGDDDVSAALLRELVTAGVDVSEWRVEGAGLEELFLELTANGGELSPSPQVPPLLPPELSPPEVNP